MITTRVAVAMEGKPSSDGRLVEVGALVLPDKPVPVTRNKKEDYMSEVVGSASAFERDEHGVVWCVVDLLDGQRVPKNYTPSLDTQLIRVTNNEDSVVIHSAKVLRIHLLPGDVSMWPELSKQ